MKQRKALYAGSFDPVTFGHMYVIEQAAHLFDEVLLGVGSNSQKRAYFSLDRRKHFLEIATQHLRGVSVHSFENMLLVEYAASVGANYIVRGIRSGTDFVFEQQMRMVIAKLQPSIEIVYFIPPPHLTEVSSTLVREFLGVPEGMRVLREYVPKPVLDELLSTT